jgi:hypothetical protein
MCKAATSTGRPRFDIADIVRAHRAQFETTRVLSVEQRRVLSAIALCRTADLGGHLDRCPDCGHERPAFNSCRNRHCPKCQALAQEEWIAKLSRRILAVPHFHVVCTMPAQLRQLAQRHAKPVFDALMHCAAETLLDLGRSRLGATLGVTMVLHTWTRVLSFHPHVHCIVTAGGLASDGAEWVPSSKRYLFPVKIMGQLLRGKMLDSLRHRRQRGGFADISDADFDRLVNQLADIDWVVYVKKAFREVDHVIKYLGRYTHRVGIANSRLVDVTDNHVTFRTKNGQTVTLDPVTFLARFVQHVLPAGFKKIRHVGLYASANANGALTTARALVVSPSAPAAPIAEPDASERPAWHERLRLLTGRDVSRCPHCGGLLRRFLVPRPMRCQARAPPLDQAA